MVFLGVIFLLAGLHIVGVDAKTPEIIAGIIETISPPKPIIKSTTVLPVSVQSAIENLVKQQIQEELPVSQIPVTTPEPVVAPTVPEPVTPAQETQK